MLTILTYDSMVAKGGLGEAIFPLFEKRCSCRVKALAAGDAGQMLSRLQLDHERGKPAAQVVLGFDQQLWPSVKKSTEPWGKWKPTGLDQIEPRVSALIGPKGEAEGFLPYDHGIFALMLDTKGLRERKLSAPRSLDDLLRPEWKRGFILEDPRTSTPGLAFVALTREARSNESAFDDYWRRLRTQWLTLAPGWDGAYGLFLKGEAPAVWSYTTSQAYHRKSGDSAGRYQAVLFQEGQPVQVEGAALVKDAFESDEERDRARDFLSFLISEDVQSKIPETNWMLPARKGVKLPESFKGLPAPSKVISAAPGDEAKAAALLKSWRMIVEGNL